MASSDLSLLAWFQRYRTSTYGGGNYSIGKPSWRWPGSLPRASFRASTLGWYPGATF